MYENYSGLGVAFLKAARGIQKEDQKYGIIRRLFASDLWSCVPSISCIHYGLTNWRRFQTRTRKRNARVWLAQIKPSLRAVAIRQWAGRLIAVHLLHPKSRHPGFADPSGEIRQFPFRDPRRFSVTKGLSIIPVDDAPAFCLFCTSSIPHRSAPIDLELSSRFLPTTYIFNI